MPRIFSLSKLRYPLDKVAMHYTNGK